VKQIGEILLSRGVEAMALARALSDRPMTRFRLCSLLISRGLLEFDEASRALADQKGVPGVLAKHLDGRDRDVARILPASFAMARCALPIGRGRAGELIVCARDPSPELRAELAKLVGPHMLVIAPATRLEELVAETYAAAAADSATRAPTESIEVDFETTGPIALDAFDVGAPQFKLVGLDDARVAKDFTQSGAHMMPPRADAGIAAGTLPPRKASSSQPPLSPLPPLMAAAVATPAPLPTPKPAATPTPTPTPTPKPPPPEPPAPDYELAPTNRPSEQRIPLTSPHAPPRPGSAPTLDETCVRLERAITRDAATDLALLYLGGRFQSSLVMLIRDDVALAHRGHGASAEAMAALAMPIAAPSLVKLAHDARKLVTAKPAGPFQDRLSRALGQPSAPAAVPLIVATRVIGALVVGDPVDGSRDTRDTRDAHEDLVYLAEALGLAYARLLLESKKSP
jgi:hypothetical protein